MINSSFIYKSKAMEKLLKEVLLIANSQSNVFIYGESGSGKEEIAKIIHEHSPRANNPFIPFNCAATLETFVREANKGSLLLDEVSEIPPSQQANLLRILQEKELEKMDVRFISTTNRDMLDAMDKKLFRKDLYYRLNVIPIYIPPLRDRRDDILPLAEYFLKNTAKKNSKEQKMLSKNAEDKLLNYHFPGNIHELINICERASIMVDKDTIHDENIFLPTAPITLPSLQGKTLKQIEAGAILQSLKEHAGNKTHAAKSLGITVKTLRSKLSSS